jgi:glycosyltransferase involved in cell wall biosynthesis
VAGAAAKAGLTQRLEAVVVDDAFDEGSGSLPDEGFESLRVRVLRHPRGSRQGAAACRNFGIRASDARVLFLLDDDDEFLPERFSRSLPLLESGSADAVLERAIREREVHDGRPSSFETGPGDQTSSVPAFQFLLTQPEEGHIATGATSFTRDAFEVAGGIDERLRFGEDGEFLLRLALTGRVALLAGAPVVHVRRHESNTSAGDRLAYWQPLRALRALYRAVDWRGRPLEAELLRRVVSGKLDYALWRCRCEYSYRRRLLEGFRALSEVPLEMITRQNLRSTVVWLLWPRPLSSRGGCDIGEASTPGRASGE